MSRYIDIELMDTSEIQETDMYGIRTINETSVQDWINNQPTADVKEVARSKWEMNSEYPDTLICSECKNKYDVWFVDKGTNFCPNCGADMRGEK